MIFGDDNAIYDLLLKNCYVKHDVDLESKPIIVGKWGAGKSAILLHTVGKLSEILNEAITNDPVWYIGETAIDKEDISNIRLFSQDYEGLKAIFEKIWRCEIIRRELILLDNLRSFYNDSTGSHWDYVSYMGGRERNLPTYWHRYPSIMKGTENSELFEAILNRKTLDNIDKCHWDIVDWKKNKTLIVTPSIIIEPLDTPTSPIENSPRLPNNVPISEPLITSLLNIYYLFIKYQKPFNWLRICVPWHRFSPEKLDLPHRIQQYYSIVRWDEEKLLTFINQRIMWEFQLRKRTFKGENAWNELFEEKILHKNFKPKIRENSFCYFVRHTHYRPRELLRLVRFALEKQAKKEGISEDVILSGARSPKITEETMIESINSYFDNKIIKLFMEEAKRRYGEGPVQDMVSLLNGITIPFTPEELNRRYRRFFAGELSHSQLEELLMRLWDSGIIGIELVPDPQRSLTSADLKKTLVNLMRIFGEKSYRNYNPIGENYMIHRWFLFEYNFEESPVSLLHAFGNDNVSSSIIIHPSIKQHFYSYSNCQYPLG